MARELKDDFIGAKIEKAKKTTFEKESLAYGEILDLELDSSKILRKWIDQFNKLMKLGTPPVWPPKFYTIANPPEQPKAKLRRRRPKK
jgi:hypothetical protein